MTVGSAGACNVILKSILDPGDEVIVLMPVFSEYQFYIANHAGRMVPVETDATFLPDVERIAAAITPRTRAIILNTPNNPNGPHLSRERSARSGTDAGPRRRSPSSSSATSPTSLTSLTGGSSPRWRRSSANTAICNSWSKSMGLAGERIGYLALSPQLADARRAALRLRLLAIASWALSTRPQSGSG